MKANVATIAMVLLALVSDVGVAQTRWDMLGRNTDLRLFIDRTGVVRKGDIATMAQLVDYTSAQWVGTKVIMSARSVAEYDCVARRTRTVAGVSYTEQMAQGVRVAEERQPDAEWLEVPRGGLAEQLWRIACGLD